VSSYTEYTVQMTCADFEKSFDHYVDGLLDPDAFAACERHVAMCKACDREVTRWQQARILLSTAVADFASVVDVSSLRADVEAALGLTGAGSPSKRRAVDREAVYERGVADRPAARGTGRSADRGRAVANGRRAAFSATLRMVSAAAVSAATAAAAVLMLTPGPQGAATMVASAPAVSAPAASSSTYSYQPASFRAARRAVEDVAPVAYTPPPLARPQVSHVDGLEAGPGHQVSTWVQPKTNARVIWVENRGMGAPVRTAGLDR
jgi:anti-sigma factor RsiW